MKYIGEIKRVISGQFKEPDEDWIRYLTTSVYEGSVTRKVREQFTPLVAKAQKQFLNDQVNDRLKAALHSERYPLGSADHDEQGANGTLTSEPIVERHLNGPDDFDTTFEELEGYQIVRAIVCSEIKPVRVTHRDAMSYFAVLLDDNNRKTVTRLHFNRPQKYLGLFDEDKVETRVPISSLEDIYNHADALRSTVRRFTQSPLDSV